MPIKVLPQWQKNEIMQAMINRGLDLLEFQWKEAPSKIDPKVTISQLVHTAPGYYFSFDFLHDLHYNERYPGTNSAPDTRYPGSWEHQFKYFFEWLNVFKTRARNEVCPGKVKTHLNWQHCGRLIIVL